MLTRARCAALVPSRAVRTRHLVFTAVSPPGRAWFAPDADALAPAEHRLAA
jgi:hypothetical protein